MAHKKGQGSTQNNRDSAGRRLGIKKFGGEKVIPGNIIVRQKGSKYVAGKNTYMGRDFTIHAAIDGIVKFTKKRIERFDGRKYERTVVNVVPSEAA